MKQRRSLPPPVSAGSGSTGRGAQTHLSAARLPGDGARLGELGGDGNGLCLAGGGVWEIRGNGRDSITGSVAPLA